MRVNVIPIQNFDKRINGLVKIDLNTLPLPSDFFIRHQMIIYLPPKQLAANHKHRRREIFICLSDNVELHWVDEEGMTHINKMKEDNQLYLFDIPPFVPHAIINLSQDSAAVLLEFADDLHNACEPYAVIHGFQSQSRLLPL